MPLTRTHFAIFDEEDPLASFRDRFDLPDGVIYLGGHTLGALPKATQGRLAEVVGVQWGQDLIQASNREDWTRLPRQVGDKIARLIGAESGSVLAGEPRSVSLFNLLATALRMRPDRRVILTEQTDASSDHAITEGLVGWLGPEYAVRSVAPAAIESALGPDVAILLLRHVNPDTGRMHDLEAVTEAAHAAEVLVLWDVADSAGVVPLHLAETRADFAVGRGDTYLNGGPGAPGFRMIARRHQSAIQPVITDISGEVGILGLAALEVGIDLALEAGIEALRLKSLRLSTLFADLIAQELDPWNPVIEVARRNSERGSQVSLRQPQASPIMGALRARGVIGEFRPPDLLRFGFAPLYTRFADVWAAVAILKDLVASGAWDQPEFHARPTLD